MRTYDNNTIHFRICPPILEIKKQCERYRSEYLDHWPAKADFVGMISLTVLCFLYAW